MKAFRVFHFVCILVASQRTLFSLLDRCWWVCRRGSGTVWSPCQLHQHPGLLLMQLCSGLPVWRRGLPGFVTLVCDIAWHTFRRILHVRKARAALFLSRCRRVRSGCGDRSAGLSGECRMQEQPRLLHLLVPCRICYGSGWTRLCRWGWCRQSLFEHF